jgi:hypothetical protein
MADEQSAEPQEAPWTRYSRAVGKKHNADVILYSGSVDDGLADDLIRLSKNLNRRENVFLLLTTRGGSPDAAYRMARSLQRHYTRVIVYVHGRCKSAGTLVAIGAHELILSDFGELGPLDVQLGKQDELFENQSGLNITQALTSLNTRVIEFFRSSLLDSRAGMQLSTRLSTDIATKLAIGVYEPIYSQIDPVQLGSMERAIQIALDYGSRLSKKGGNLKPEAVERLVSRYPSHSFVIDVEEAENLFKNVRVADDTEELLGECISFVTRDENSDHLVSLLNPPADDVSQSPITDVESTEGVLGGGSTSDTPSDSPAGTAQTDS